MNDQKNMRIEFHILQSFPVTCLNRDDVGAPKTAIVGGATRARVSSQCWKRYVRLALREFGVKLAVRTKHVSEMLADACRRRGADETQSSACGETMAAALVDDTLLFISEMEADAFAEYAESLGFDQDKLKDKKKSKKKSKKLIGIAKKTIPPSLDALDIALFGRMVAKAPDMNIEAASSFSHALSTHRVSNEVEFFTALDDWSDAPGSAHMGSLEFNSATYYRYVSLDVRQLASRIADEQDVKVAVAAFVKALFVAVPGARQTTQSGASPWEFARVLIRTGQRLQVPFETAVKAKEGGFLQPSIDALKAYLDQKEKLSGSLFGKIASYEWGEDQDFDIDDLVSALQSHI